MSALGRRIGLVLLLQGVLQKLPKICPSENVTPVHMCQVVLLES